MSRSPYAPISDAEFILRFGHSPKPERTPDQIREDRDAESRLDSLRWRVKLGETTNPLIQWTISDDWTMIPSGRSQVAIHGEIG